MMIQLWQMLTGSAINCAKCIKYERDVRNNLAVAVVRNYLLEIGRSCAQFGLMKLLRPPVSGGEELQNRANTELRIFKSFFYERDTSTFAIDCKQRRAE